MIRANVQSRKGFRQSADRPKGDSSAVDFSGTPAKNISRHPADSVSACRQHAREENAELRAQVVGLKSGIREIRSDVSRKRSVDREEL